MRFTLMRFTLMLLQGALPMTLIQACRSALCLLLFAIVMPSAQSQNVDDLPDDFDAVIQLKTKALQSYSAQRNRGDADAAVDTLKTIVNLHRKALQLAEANSADAEIIRQLWQVFANDSEFLSDELFSRGAYTESTKLRNEVEQLLTARLGADHIAVTLIHWKAVTSKKLSTATAAKRKAWLSAAEAEAKAKEALQSQELELASRLYQQVVSAQTAVLGEIHPDVAASLNELGRVQWMMEEFDSAEVSYKRSLKAREASTGRDLQYATTLFNLGRVYQSTQRFDDAEKQYLATAAIEEPILGSASESFLQTLQQLAALYTETGASEKLAGIEQRLAAADPLAAVLTHLPVGTFAAVAVQPSQLAQNPSLQMLPFELLEATGREEFGFNPMDLEAVVAFMTTPIAEPPLNFGVAMKFRAGVEPQFKWMADVQPVEFSEEVTYHKLASDRPDAMCFFQFSDGVSLIGTEQTIRESLANTGATVVADVLKASRHQGQLVSAANLKMIRGILAVAMAQTPPVPEPLEALKQLPVTTDLVKLSIDMTAGLKISMQLETSGAEAAQQAAESIRNGLALGMQMAVQQLEAELVGEEPVQVATRSYANRMIRRYLSAMEPTVSESTVVLQFDVVEHSIGPLAVTLLLPAVQAAREAAQRTEDKNDLKQLAIGMYQYESVHGQFPARANYDENGNPLLSWRVHLLPFLEETTLYEQFHLNEPWDSEHNLPLAEKIPEVFRSHQLRDKSKTAYQSLDGPGTMMDGTEGIRLVQASDGLSHTLLIVEADADRAVIWTKPDDLRFDPQNPKNGLGNIRKEGFHAAFSDGSVRMIPGTIDPETLKNLAIRNDGGDVGDY